MNIIELQENFEKACFYYASKHSPVQSFDELFEAHYVKNENKKDGEPNYYKRITKWNHSSEAPTDSELMKYSVNEVHEHFKMMIPGFSQSHMRILKCDDSFRKKMSLKSLKDGDLIFNTTNMKLEIFLDGSIYELETKKVS